MTLEHVIEAEKTATEAVKNAKSLRLQFMKNCEHQDVVEGEYGGNCTASPPFRVCKLCGYTEEGWYCGYTLLNGNYPEVSRDEAFKFVHMFLNNEKVADFKFGRYDPFSVDKISEVR